MEATRRVILEVRGSPEAIRRVVVEPGQAIRVGRTQLAGVVVADDKLSSVHFELAWDGRRCVVRDLGGAGGTLVGGFPAAEAEVTSGDWIRAGVTDMSVYFEDDTPAPRAQPALIAEGAREAALSALHDAAGSGPLYAILDAARTRRVLTLLRESVDEYDSLYQGITAETMADYAPYLVRMRPGSRLLPRLAGEGWGDAWGVYLTSASPLREVRAHLRKLIYVKNEDLDDVVYFRFYDPRVLRVFLPTCGVRQEDEFFGPIDRFLCEDGDGRFLSFTRRKAAGRG